MPWCFPWPDYIKKKACRYLLQHYVGNFLEEKLTLDQLSVDLYSGTGTVKDVKLDVWNLNEVLESVGAPVEIRDGCVSSISVEIPWSSLLTANSKVEIKGLEITVQPKYRLDSPGSSGSMGDSMWSSMSMSSSMQLAQECLKQDTDGVEPSESSSNIPFEGPELLAQTIESVLTRVEVTLIDTLVRLEHVPQGSNSGVALEVHIERLRFFDEVARDTLMDLGSSVDRDQLHNFVPAAIAHKNLQMMGVTIHCEEFPEEQRLSTSTSPESDRWGKEGGNAFDNLASSPDMPPQHHEVGGKKSPKVLKGGSQELLESCIVGECSGKQEIKLKIKQNEQISGPKAEIDTYLGSINLFFSPRQVHLLLELVNGFLSPATSDTASVRGKQPNKPMQAEDYQRIESDLQERFLQQQRQEDLLRRQSWGLQSEDEDFMEPSLVQSIDDSDMFFSMSSSMMSMSAPGHYSDDMESSISSTMSTCSTDTSRTGSSISRLGYGNPYYRRPDSSPFASTIPKGAAKKSRSKRGGLSDHLDDPMAEATRYKLRFSSLSLTVLHEDPPHMPHATATTDTTNGNTLPMSPPRTAAPPGKTASRMLQERADNFFFVLGRQAYGMKNQAEWKDRFARACPYDHLRFVAAPVTLECEKKQNNTVSYVSLDLSLGTLELLECLFERHNSELLMSVAGTPDPRPPTPNHIEILSFAEERSGSVTETTKSCVHVRLKHMERTYSQSSHHRNLSKPKTELSIELGALRCEIDISIVDRLYALLHPQPVGQYRDSSNGRYTSLSAHGGMQNKQALFTATLEESSTVSNHLLTVSASCSKAHVAFRFPIPDLRDMNNVAWWKRSLRDEILYVELQETYFKTRNGDESSHQTMLLECKEIHGSLQLTPESAPVSFIRINPAQVDCASEERRFYWPRMVVKIFPVSQTSVLEEESEIGDPLSHTPQNSWEEICQFAETEPSPFSSKKVMYESEQMVMPGDHEEMKEFMKHCVSNSRVTLDITIPRVNILLPSKEFMETLYNRFGNDLLLWEPAAPTPRDHPDSYLSFAGIDGGLDMTQLMNIGNSDKFTMCRSAAAAALDSDSDDEDDSGRFLTIGDREELQWRKRNAQQKASSLQNLMALTLNINHGKLAVWSPIKDSEGSVSSSTHGDTLLEIEDGQFFTVSQYQGDPNLSHLCIQANRFAIYHNGEVEMPIQVDPIPPANWKHADHLQCCVYMSDDGGHTKPSGSVAKEENSQKMFALAMKMQFQPLKNVKTIECALGVRGTTLQHYVCKPEHSWMVQLGEFFDVIDETILGYDMPRVVTELHAHWWDCGIDYRPKYLPFRTFLGIETLSISSNLVYESKESLLRFLIDDASLYLSDKCIENKVDLRRNYVCVVEVGLLELAMRLSTDPNKNPKMDLKVSNNVVHIRTCADSCSALTKLLLYLANDGDMKGPPQYAEEQPEENNTAQVHFTEPMNTPTKPAAPVKTNLPTPDSPVRQGHIDQMHQLMEEAMKELNCSKSPKDTDIDDEEILHLPCTLKQSPNSEVFLFPNEDGDDTFHNVVRPHPTPPKPEPVEQHFPSLDSQHFDGETEADSDGSDFFNDDDFCVLDDPGMGVLSKDGQPEVKCLDENPVQIKEDHFNKPLGRGDQLNAPADFPTPIMKYTLQEMTLVWHIYGGNDLGAKKPESRTSSPAHVTVGTADKPSRGDTQHSPSSRKIHYRPVNPNQLSHKERGGVGRDHNVLMELQLNKFRFRHEVYPDDTREASRQILVISDIEIRDKLAQSNINKFLYLYSSEARPRRTHANMVLVKALHIRPDPNLSAEECCLRVSLQPLRLNIDQDALFFLRDFFTDVSNEATKVPIYPDVRRGSINVTPTPSSPCISSQPSLTSQHSSIATTQTSIATRHSLQFEEDSIGSAAEIDDFAPMSTRTLVADSVQYTSTTPSVQSNDSISSSIAAANTPPLFFRSFVFSPDVPIKLDYEGKRVDMEQGTLIGLLVGLGQLNKSELTLKRLLNRHGLLGIDKLLVYVMNEWALDIKKRQLPSILGGVGPMHSLVQLVQGTVDLFRLPIEQYQKDGRLMRGIQRGANSFGTSTAMACVELTNRMVRVMQTAAETAYDMVSPGPSVTQRAITYGPFGQQRLARQPTDFREGMANAITVVREGLGDTANAMMQVAVEEHEHKGYSGAVGGILRQIPPSVIKPLILATEATSSVLGGMRNQMLPDARKEDSDKWKSEER